MKTVHKFDGGLPDQQLLDPYPREVLEGVEITPAGNFIKTSIVTREELERLYPRRDFKREYMCDWADEEDIEIRSRFF